MGREVARQVVEGSNGHPETEREVPEPLQECGTERGSHTALCHLQVDWKKQITQ